MFLSKELFPTVSLEKERIWLIFLRTRNVLNNYFLELTIYLGTTKLFLLKTKVVFYVLNKLINH